MRLDWPFHLYYRLFHPFYLHFIIIPKSASKGKPNSDLVHYRPVDKQTTCVLYSDLPFCEVLRDYNSTLCSNIFGNQSVSKYTKFCSTLVATMNRLDLFSIMSVRNIVSGLLFNWTNSGNGDSFLIRANQRLSFGLFVSRNTLIFFEIKMSVFFIAYLVERVHTHVAVGAQWHSIGITTWIPLSN